MSAEAGARRLEDRPDTTKEFDAGVYVNGSDITFGASGITGVWAKDNTRESIYNAFRRKETFATTGTRIKVRFFGGYDFTDETLEAPDMLETAYSEGVSMGSDLLPNGDRAPRFIVWATQDALSAPLQRLQVIKGWTVDGEPHEQVFDVACSDGLAVDPLSHRCGDNGAQVNLGDCSISVDAGAAELKTVWTDPDFDPSVRAFYYVRVLENPTCRWSTWDAISEGYEPRPDLPATIQERAFTSPIWYRPSSGNDESLEEPRVWFVVLGIVIFVIDEQTSDPLDTIVVDAALERQLAALWAAQVQREPTRRDSQPRR